MRRTPGPRLSRRTAPDWTALLHQFGVAHFRKSEVGPLPRYSQIMSRARIALASAFLLTGVSCFAQAPALVEDTQLDQVLQAITVAHHGHVALYAHNLKTGQTASLSADLPVKTASVIKLAILLDAAEQIRAGTAKLDERLVLTGA